jgi:hypothetical protein
LQYLRFDVGRYGVARLQELVAQKGADAEPGWPVAGSKSLRDQRARFDNAEVPAKLYVYPEGRSLDPDLKTRLQAGARR